MNPTGDIEERKVKVVGGSKRYGFGPVATGSPLIVAR